MTPAILRTFSRSLFPHRLQPLSANRLAAAILCSLFAATSLDAAEGTIVVGSSGASAGCTETTIQAAIDRARNLDADATIIVTDDVADGVWREALRIENMHAGRSLEIVGGFNSCSDLTRNGGRTRVDGGDSAMSALNIVGRADVTLRGLAIEGSAINGSSPASSGISFEGRGRLELAAVTVSNHAGAGIELHGRHGEAQLELTGDVEVADNAASGIDARSSSLLTIRGDGNTIRGNNIGVLLQSPATADIGATGDLLVNNGIGIAARGMGSTPSRTTRVYSTDPANPLAIAGNVLGGIVLDSPEAPYRMCIKNVAIVENDAFALYANGRNARLEINGDCDYPTAAAISCSGPSAHSECNTLSGNGATADQPLIEALDGAHIAIDGMDIRANVASMVLSASAAGKWEKSSIDVTNSDVDANATPGRALRH